jgi:hypothetical protein
MRSHSNNTLHEILSKHAARIWFACYFRLLVDALDRVEAFADAPLCELFDEEDLAVRLFRELRDDDVFA